MFLKLMLFSEQTFQEDSGEAVSDRVYGADVSASETNQGTQELLSRRYGAADECVWMDADERLKISTVDILADPNKPMQLGCKGQADWFLIASGGDVPSRSPCERESSDMFWYTEIQMMNKVATNNGGFCEEKFLEATSVLNAVGDGEAKERNWFAGFHGGAVNHLIGDNEKPSEAEQDQTRRKYKALYEVLRRTRSVLKVKELDHRKTLVHRLEYADKCDIIAGRIVTGTRDFGWTPLLEYTETDKPERD
ncbi:unnamed protein product [Angiostrongylus costaricensis]|uniref:Ricin B-type lectin domain-containing protein n=1 Tax=Angiostrongylus costaricensis TaxID=334426 RepID=A0A158PMA9_ANGCS|nr:unnamed protein product [Angiostrongylus costaricensis]